MKYNFDSEMPKIKNSFERMKNDVLALHKALGENIERIGEQNIIINELKREVLSLKGKGAKVAAVSSPAIIVTTPVPKGRKLVGNITSQKVHFDNCMYAKKIAENNLATFKSVEEAMEQGYGRCSCLRR